MSLTLSPQMKIFALVGALAVLALGVGSMMLGKSQPSTSASAPVVLKHFHPKKAAAPVAATPTAKPAKHAAAPAKAKAPAAKPAAAETATPAPAQPAPTIVPAVATNGLPTPLDQLLHGHRVVIVALWDPEIPSDRFAYLEAQAGARAANAGFLGISVLDERVAAPLTALIGNGTVLPSPGVLVFKQPSTLMNKIDGFVDRDAIAEAIANAQIADTPPQGLPPMAAPAAAPAAPAR